MPVRRRVSSAEPPIQRAFREACIREGHSTVEDTNGANPVGVGVSPTNNLGGVRVSTAIAYLSQNRHRLNLTVRGEVYVRRVLFEDGRAVGVEAESGGELFTVEAEKVVLSSGALRSPQLLMLSGIGPKDHLEEMGIPVIRDLPGVGQSLFNHLSVHINFKVKDGVELPVDLDAPHYRMIFTAPDSELEHDLVLSTVNVVDEREERVRGVRTQYRTGDVPADRAARLSCTLGVPRGSGYVRLGSSDPSVQPSFNYRYLQHPEDVRRVREGIRFGARLLESDAYSDVVDFRITPTDEELSDDDALDLYMRRTVGTARHVSGTCRMGPDSDPMTVVDQYCRVKGLQNLWVADASVVPQLLRGGGLHPTVVMIGEARGRLDRTGLIGPPETTHILPVDFPGYGAADPIARFSVCAWLFRRDPTVDDQLNPCGPGCLVRGEVERSISDVAGDAKAPEGHLVGALPQHLGVVGYAGQHGCVHRAGVDGVAADVLLRRAELPWSW